MATVINMGDLRWAQEPVGTDTKSRYTPMAVEKRCIRKGVYASLWKLKNG